MSNPFDKGFYNSEELRKFGFKKVGYNVIISKNCEIIGLEKIEIGDNVRVDAYTTLLATGKGYIKIGSYVHIAGYCYFGGGAGIVMRDFSATSQGTKIYSKSDDYSGKYMTNPTVPHEYTGVIEGEIIIGKHVVVGGGTVIFPGCVLDDGCSVGALTLVNKSLQSWFIYAGCPAKKIKERQKDVIFLEQKMINSFDKNNVR